MLKCLEIRHHLWHFHCIYLRVSEVNHFQKLPAVVFVCTFRGVVEGLLYVGNKAILEETRVMDFVKECRELNNMNLRVTIPVSDTFDE